MPETCELYNKKVGGEGCPFCSAACRDYRIFKAGIKQGRAEQKEKDLAVLKEMKSMYEASYHDHLGPDLNPIAEIYRRCFLVIQEAINRIKE